MKYAGIIFDLDGVLCHTDHYHYLAWKTIADEIGAAFSEADNDRLRGVSRMESFQIILEKYDGAPMTAAMMEDLAYRKNEIYRAYLEGMTPGDVAEDVQQTLDELCRRDILLAVGSSSRNAQLILEKLQLGHYFRAVIDGHAISRSKPDPEVFLKAAEALGLLPADCLVVEDATAGAEAAIAGGFDCAGIGPAASATLTLKPPLVLWPITQVSDVLHL